MKANYININKYIILRKSTEILCIFMILLGLSSCFEEDERIEPHKTGDVLSANVELSDNYLYQVYYDLGTNSYRSSNKITDWDLGFDCSDSTYYIIVNNALKMAVANMGKIPFDSVNSAPHPDNDIWRWDHQDGNLEQTAFGQWYSTDNGQIVSKKDVYIVDRGLDENGMALGQKKIMIEGFDNNSYLIKYGNLDGSEADTAIISKDNSFNFTFFSFELGQQNLEPPKDSWDLLLSRNREPLATDEGDTLQYIVVGAYLNRYNVEANFLDSNIVFESITYSDIQNLELSKKINIIGHEWKTFNFDNGLYIVNTGRTYIIKDTDGFYYKLRFIGFYNSEGDKGYPQFEFQKI